MIGETITWYDITKSGRFCTRKKHSNVLLTYKTAMDIKKRTKTPNVVIKLDMTKAYDGLSRLFITKVLRKFGFSEMIVDMVYRTLSHNWNSILSNQQSHGLFRSSRGMKQGDLMSPTYS